MKLALSLLFTFVTFVTFVAMIELEDVIERVAQFLNMSKDEVQGCFNDKNITREDLMKYDMMLVDNLQATDTQDINLKVGCLLACLGQKKKMMTGARLNLNKMKEWVQERLQAIETRHNPEKLARVEQYIDLCANQVKTITDECGLAFTFVRCLSV